MRALPLVVIALVAAALSPVARAEPAATLAWSGPTEVDLVDGAATVALRLDLSLSGFACPRDEAVLVQLSASGAPARVALAAEQVAFRVPSGSYFNEPYVGAADVELRVEGGGEGQVRVSAMLDDDMPSCVVPGGFPRVEAIHAVATRGALAPAPPANSTSEENATAPPGSTGPATNGTAPPANDTSPRDPSQLGPEAGYIGEYQPAPQESRAEAPGAAVVGVVAAVLVAAGTLKRRFR